MTNMSFVSRAKEYQRPVRQIIATPTADTDHPPITKLGGAPFWPNHIPRPKCALDHPMGFYLQVALSDLPNNAYPADALLSFHYCDQCSYAGLMSFGCHDQNRGYDVRILRTSGVQADDLGQVGETCIASHKVSFRNTAEIPDINDLPIEIAQLSPDDYPQGQDDFDEIPYPGLIHVMRTKVGGWPSWVQDPEWPPNESNHAYQFIAQIDWELGTNTAWGGGGYAYLFAPAPDRDNQRGELVVQTT